MNKFDRYIFIFIGLGIWAFVITQFISPTSLNAIDYHEHFDEIRLTVTQMCTVLDIESGEINCF